jgi:hypothetical protein
MWPSLLFAQSPDARGEVALTSPSYQGTEANAPIPAEMHIRNEGGSDGQGLCVIASSIINGEYQGVPGIAGLGKESPLWEAAKRRPGGYFPEKLTKLIDEVLPEEKYANYLQSDPSILHRLSAEGYAIGATMNTGQLYNYQHIAHMISLNHYQTDKWACVVDNNDPGKYHWMPAKEFDHRWTDGGTGWAFVWTRKKIDGGRETEAYILLAMTAVIVLMAVEADKRRINPPRFSP